MANENRSGNWEIVDCPVSNDESRHTLRETASGQLMHSRIGPWTEANGIYIAQSELDRRVFSPVTLPLVIYDVGLGIAANPLAAIAAFRAAGKGRSLEIYSFERFPEALTCALEQPEKFAFLLPHVGILRSLLQNEHWRSDDQQIHWHLIGGDFREAQLSTPPAAELVFFDFYAPSVCPELWEVSVFEKLYPKMAPDGLLITYSSTKAVRAALLLAGFYVGHGVSTALKRDTTVAASNFESLRSPLNRDWLTRLERSEKVPPEARAQLKTHPQFN